MGYYGKGAHALSIETTISPGSSLSEAVPLGDNCVASFVADGWTAAVVTFAGSFDGNTFFPVYDRVGEVTCNSVDADRIIQIEPEKTYGLHSIKIRSGTSTSAVNQAVERTITVRIRPVD